MKKFILNLIFILFNSSLLAQVSNTGLLDTTNGTALDKLIISGYIDTYFGVTNAKTIENNIPYFVNMQRNNELNVNLAFIDLRYRTDNFRARFIPGFGTYVNANYTNENGTLKNIIESSVGFKLFKNKNIWADVGVLGSPYTNESAISKDHLMYTRSFAPEYVPYYLSGIKFTIPLNQKFMAYLYLLNGWQIIQDNNAKKSLGTQLEYRPNQYHLFNWNTYIGNEQSTLNPNFTMRYFTDLYWIYSKNNWAATSCIYIGNQLTNENTTSKNNIWWQANLIGKYAFNSKYSLSGRVEYFKDPNNIHVISTNLIPGFSSFSGGLCFNYNINKNSVFRVEARQFWTEENHYLSSIGNPDNKMTWIISNITAYF
jgi:hypothetical protein